MAIILATERGFFQRLLGTTTLTVEQWVVCICVALSVVVVEEARNLLKVTTGDEATAAVAPARLAG